MSATYAYAISEDGNSIHISSAERGSHGYFCRYCGNPMIARKGTVKVHHFAHKAKCDCDSWYHGKGEWHREMQDMFPKECQEVILENNGEKHIADVCMTKPNGQRLVIEFQDSPMSREDFVTRTLFWKSNGADMIWVFNLSEKDIREFPEADERDYLAYEWKRPFSTLGNEFIKSVPIIFYIKPTIKTRYRISSYAGRFERISIEGREGFPIFVRLTGNGNDFVIRSNGIYINKEGYGMFKGERCYILTRFVSERMSYYSDAPFLEYDHQLQVAFPSRDDIPNNLMRPLYEQTQVPGAVPVSFIIYARKEKAICRTHIYLTSEKDFIDDFRTKYGDENIKIVRQ